MLLPDSGPVADGESAGRSGAMRQHSASCAGWQRKRDIFGSIYRGAARRLKCARDLQVCPDAAFRGPSVTRIGQRTAAIYGYQSISQSDISPPFVPHRYVWKIYAVIKAIIKVNSQ